MKLMLDTIEYNSKPQGREVGIISNRIITQPVDISVEELAINLIKGKTFIPASFKEREGRIKRNKDYWYSQQVIGLDFDEGMTLQEAIQEFSDTASFIYTTFSHTEEKHKFRVVFALDRPIYRAEEFQKIITELMTKYPQADEQCKDCTRLFFGGKKLYVINYKNQLKVDDWLRLSPEVSGRTKKNLVLYPPKNQVQQKQKNLESSSRNTLIASNIDLIKQKDIRRLQKKIKPKPKVVHSNFEFLEYLKQQDLRLYLGLNPSGNFIDVFHDETNPSASIFESSKGNGHQLYHCFSTSNPFTGTIFQVTERLLAVSILEVKKFLMELYNVEIEESEKQKELKGVIDIYKEMLYSDDLEELYPNFYKVFNTYGYLQDMYILLDLVKEHLPSGGDARLLFHHSINTIAQKFGRSNSAAHTRMNFFTFFKLISKLKEEEIPKKLLDIQQSSKSKKGHRYLNSTYEMHIYSYDFFKELDAMCVVWMGKGCTTKTINYEGILRNFGREEADRVFPQDKGKEIPPLNEEVTDMIRNTTLQQIAEKGWTSEQEVLDNVLLYFKGQKNFKQKQFKICLGEILDDYNLERIRLNKDIKAEMCIEGNGFGYIIRNIRDEGTDSVKTDSQH